MIATRWEIIGMKMMRKRRVERRVRRREMQRLRSKRERRRPCEKERRARSRRRRATERGRGKGKADGGLEDSCDDNEVEVVEVGGRRRISELMEVDVLRRYNRKNAHSSNVMPANSVARVPDTLRKSALKGPRPPAGCFARVRGGGTVTWSDSGDGGGGVRCEVDSGREEGLFGCEDDDELVVFERMHTTTAAGWGMTSSVASGRRRFRWRWKWRWRLDGHDGDHDSGSGG